jgi:flagellar basal body L-ring protein FlgH
MVVSGRREIHIDDETKLIEFTGIVRRYDIKSDNTIASELVANANVIYRGCGPLTESTKRYGVGGMIHRAIAWLWPF